MTYNENKENLEMGQNCDPPPAYNHPFAPD